MIGGEQLADVARAPRQHAVDLLEQLLVVLLDPDGNVELHRPLLVGEPRRHRLEPQRHRRLRREIAGERAPDERHVDIAALDRVDDLGRRVGLRIIAVKHVAADVGDDPAARQAHAPAACCSHRRRPSGRRSSAS